MSDDWADVLGALPESRARFLVVGAHAMAVHGVPRGTQDLDVDRSQQRERRARVARALPKMRWRTVPEIVDGDWAGLGTTQFSNVRPAPAKVWHESVQGDTRGSGGRLGG